MLKSERMRIHYIHISRFQHMQLEVSVTTNKN